MEENLVGYRFYPTGEELINHYLKNKIRGRSWLVDEAISEINICDHEPDVLPQLSKIKSKDNVWYFFCRKEITTEKKKGTKRTTTSGFWKVTGVDREIKDRRGNGVKIGIKKTLVYHKGKAAKGVGTPWVIHEYHITSLPLNQRTYVICQVMYKGNDGDSLYCSNYPAEVLPQIPYVDDFWTDFNGGNLEDMFLNPDVTMDENHSMVSDSNTLRAINTAREVEQPVQEDNFGFSEDDFLLPMNYLEDHCLFDPEMLLSDDYSYLQQQTPCDDEHFLEMDDVFPSSEIIMLENHNNHMPKKPLQGIIVDCTTDSDAESISATGYQGTSSPGDSDGSSSRHFYTSVDEILSSRKDSCIDIKTFINRKTRESYFTRHTKPSKQEVKEGKSKAVDTSMDKSSSSSSSMVKTEKKGWFITEEAMQINHKNPPYIYLMNMFIGFILLVAVIGNIISALQSFKT